MSGTESNTLRPVVLPLARLRALYETVTCPAPEGYRLFHRVVGEDNLLDASRFNTLVASCTGDRGAFRISPAGLLEVVVYPDPGGAWDAGAGHGVHAFSVTPATVHSLLNLFAQDGSSPGEPNSQASTPEGE